MLTKLPAAQTANAVKNQAPHAIAAKRLKRNQRAANARTANALREQSVEIALAAKEKPNHVIAANETIFDIKAYITFIKNLNTNPTLCVMTVVHRYT